MAYALHPHLQAWQPWIKDPPPFSRYALLLLVTVAIWLVCIVALRLHRLGDRPWRPAALFWGLVRVNLLGLLFLALLLYLTQAVFNRSLIAVFVGSSFCLLYLERLALTSWLRHQYEAGLTRTNVLLVGDPSNALHDYVRAAAEARYPPRFVGRLGKEPAPIGVAERNREITDEVSGSDPNPPSTFAAMVDWLGPVEALENVLHDHSVDEVAFFPPHHDPVHEKTHLKSCETLGIPALFSVSMEPISESRPQVATRHYKPFVLFDISPRPAGALLAKQMFDTTASAVGIILLSPLLVLTTLAVWIFMGRPIFFSQKRAGLFGREFRMVKFRTMTGDAERLRAAGKVMNELSGPVFKSTSDPRITPLGRILRRWSLDELPQLFNVLGGAMSLVGPRPLPIDEQREIRGWRRRRLSMKPGITGLWQVSGRSDVDFEQWMRLDLRYVDEWSLRLDAILLLKTFKAVLSGKGAR